MKYDVLQVLGMLVLAVFGQGLVRLLLDHGHRGLLGWLPGGFAPALVAHAALSAAGLLLTGWAYRHARVLGRR
ncbi:hypothetical protein IHE55_29945 [Streptomyces pactum]|uniref:Uncharacterized protein n=1 Tax=Streptomyces pactum TaxID=68249 RepID=A0ABS0NU77_9ACTN|nr:hypothetical protein [Streptomyces pactum]MBH5338774.1 hypothetical protein [Streptomyces pactum]